MTTEQAFIEKGDLDDRLSVAIVRKIFDDDNSGTANDASVARVIADASSRFAGVLRGLGYPLPLPTPIPEDAKRYTLDIAEWMAAKRHPEVARKNWVELKKSSDDDLALIRKGIVRLAIPKAEETPATTPANVGAATGSTAGTDPDLPQGRFENMGDF